jgi:hypothetical protein
MQYEHNLKLFRYFAAAPGPMPADASAVGTLPTRAFRYCEALRLAGGWGYWLFPPLSFSVVWDGDQIKWTSAEREDWQPLQDTGNFPGFPEAWDAECPPDFRGMCPPFLTALPEPGLLQISLGIIATTEPGWLLYMRPPPNFPGVPHTQSYVGAVDGEAYEFGPIFTNLRLCKTDTPIMFQADRPILQLSALPRRLLTEDARLLKRDLVDMKMWTDAEWQGYYRTIVDPYSRPNRPYGENATRARRLARACPALEKTWHV